MYSRGFPGLAPCSWPDRPTIPDLDARYREGSQRRAGLPSCPPIAQAGRTPIGARPCPSATFRATCSTNKYEVRAFAHGCNCQGSMGAGVAKTFPGTLPARCSRSIGAGARPSPGNSTSATAGCGGISPDHRCSTSARRRASGGPGPATRRSRPHCGRCGVRRTPRGSRASPSPGSASDTAGCRGRRSGRSWNRSSATGRGPWSCTRNSSPESRRGTRLLR